MFFLWTLWHRCTTMCIFTNMVILLCLFRRDPEARCASSVVNGYLSADSVSTPQWGTSCSGGNQIFLKIIITKKLWMFDNSTIDLKLLQVSVQRLNEGVSQILSRSVRFCGNTYFVCCCLDLIPVGESSCLPVSQIIFFFYCWWLLWVSVYM